MAGLPALSGIEAQLRPDRVFYLFIGDAEQRFFSLVETAAEPGFFRAHDAIRAEIRIRKYIGLEVHAFTGAVAIAGGVVPVLADGVGAGVGAVAGSESAAALAGRHFVSGVVDERVEIDGSGFRHCGFILATGLVKISRSARARPARLR